MKDEIEVFRELMHTDNFDEFFNSVNERVKDKIANCIEILETVYVLSTKFVKKIIDADVGIFEMRVSVGSNEYRIILYSMDHKNIIQAKTVILLNGFLKKDKKDYKKQVKKAINILNRLEYDSQIRP